MPRRSRSPIWSTWSRARSGTRPKPGSCRSRSISIPTSGAASRPIRSACSRCSRICCRTRSSSPRRAACGSTSRRSRAAGARSIPCSIRRPRWSRSRSPTPASAFRSRSRRSSSKPSSRPMPAPAANTAEPAWVSPSAASCRTCSAAKSICAARRASAAPSRSILPLKYVGPSAAPKSVPAAPGTAAHAPGIHVSGLPERPIEQISDDRLAIEPGDFDPAHRRGRSALCPHHGRSRAREGLQGAGRDARRRCARPRQAIPADRRVARRVPARHAGLDGAQPAQAEPADPAHSGADHHLGRGSPARPGARRILVRHQADLHRGRGGGAGAHQGIRQAAAQASAGRGGRPAPSR